MTTRDSVALGRRGYLSLLALSSVAGCAGGDDDGEAASLPATPREIEGASWPMLGYSAAGNPVVDVASFGEHGLRQRWRREVSMPESDAAEPAMPVVADDVVVFPGLDRVVAFDGGSGEKRWSLDRSIPHPQPCVSDGVVYVPYGNDSDARNLGAFDLESGDEEWVAEAGAPRWPIVYGDTVYVRGDEDEATVVAVDTASGDELWRAGDGPGTTRAAIADSVLVVGTDDGLRGFDAASGDELWTAEPAEAVETAPTIDSGSVYVGTSGGVVRAYDLEDGTGDWSFDLPGGIATSPAVFDGTVFVGNETDDPESEAMGRCYALDASGGSVDWTFDTRFSVSASPVVVDGAVLFPSMDTLLYAISVSGGERLWTQWCRGPTTVMPAVTEDAVYVASDDQLFAFEERTEPLGTSDVGGWETAGGGPGYRRYRPEAAPVTDDAEIRFDRQLESQLSEEFITGPVLSSDGAVMAFLTARDALSGDVIWRPPIFAWPQVATDGIVAMDTWEDGGVYGVSLDDGRIVWHVETDAAQHRINGAGDAMVITHPNTGTRAIEAGSGDELWSTDALGGGWMPALDDETVFVVAPHRENRVSAFDRSTGDEVATADVDHFEAVQPGPALNRPPRLGENQRTPVLGDERLFVPVEGTVLGLDRSTLGIDWVSAIADGGSTTVSALAYDGDSLYCSYSGGGIASLDPASGDTLWERPLDSSPSDLIATDDSVYVSAWKSLVGIDPGSGEPQWSRDFEALVAEMAHGGDRLFLRMKSPPMQEANHRLLALAPQN